MSEDIWSDYDIQGEGFGAGGLATSTGGDAYFRPGEYGIDLVVVLDRAQVELKPGQDATFQWSWSISGQQERDKWSTEDGTTIVHSADKHINASSEVGKLLTACKQVFTNPPRPVNPQSAAWWKALVNSGEITWTWVEEPKMMPNPDNPAGRWIPDPSKADKPKRRMIPVGVSGEVGSETSNGEVETIDLATLGLDEEQLAELRTASSMVDGYGPFVSKAMPFMGASETLREILGDEKRTAALRAALTP